MTKALLGLDIGTTSTKAILFTTSGAELSRANSPAYTNKIPQPGWVEQNPEEVWQAVITAIHGAIENAPPDIKILALSIAAQSGSVIPANSQGEPVYPLITWMDGRTQELVKQWQNEGVGEQVRDISGWSLYPGLCLPTISWLYQHDKETFANASHYFSVNDFIAHRLTGEYCTNPSNGGGMQFIDIHTGEWSETLCALAGISPAQLSPVCQSGVVIGEILDEVCRLTGLPPGVMLINGGHDQGCTALGLGITAPGKLLLACGTAWVVTGVAASPNVKLIPPALDMNFHVAPQRWTISQSLGGLGASLEWWINQAWRGVNNSISRQDMYAALDDELSQTAPDSGLYFLPLTGGYNNPATTKSGGFKGLNLSHTRADMARAIMESAAFELRYALEAARQAELPVERLWMVGGAAQSLHWPTILANITGVPISLPQYDNWPAVGAAILAGVGIGAFENIKDGLACFEKPTQNIVPDEETLELYDSDFTAKRSISPQRHSPYKHGVHKEFSRRTQRKTLLSLRLCSFCSRLDSVFEIY